MDQVGKFLVNIIREESTSQTTGRRILLSHVRHIKLELRVYLPRQQLPLLAYLRREFDGAGEVLAGVNNFRDIVCYRVWQLSDLVQHVLPLLNKHEACLIRQRREADAMRLCATWLATGAGRTTMG